MANHVFITIREQREMEFDFNNEGTYNLELNGPKNKIAYINCDEVCAQLGYFDTIEELEEIISEENIIESIEDTLSEYESDMIMTVLRYKDYEYHLGYWGVPREAKVKDK